MEMPQTHIAFAAPMKELERLLKSGMLHHGANPILRWRMANLVVKADHDGGLKPDKRRSHEKIDAVVALTMALDGVVRQPLETGSVYDTRGVEFVKERAATPGVPGQKRARVEELWSPVEFGPDPRR